MTPTMPSAVMIWDIIYNNMSRLYPKNTSQNKTWDAVATFIGLKLVYLWHGQISLKNSENIARSLSVRASKVFFAYDQIDIHSALATAVLYVKGHYVAPR